MNKRIAQSYRNAAQRAQAIKNRKIIANLESSPERETYSAVWQKNKLKAQATRGVSKPQTSTGSSELTRKPARASTSPQRQNSGKVREPSPKSNQKRDSSPYQRISSNGKQTVSTKVTRYSVRTTNSSPIKALSKHLTFIQKRNSIDATSVNQQGKRKPSPKSSTAKPNVSISVAEYKPLATDSIHESKILKEEDVASDSEGESISAMKQMLDGVKYNATLPPEGESTELPSTEHWDTYESDDYEDEETKIPAIKKDEIALDQGRSSWKNSLVSVQGHSRSNTVPETNHPDDYNPKYYTEDKYKSPQKNKVMKMVEYDPEEYKEEEFKSSKRQRDSIDYDEIVKNAQNRSRDIRSHFSSGYEPVKPPIPDYKDAYESDEYAKEESKRPQKIKRTKTTHESRTPQSKQSAESIHDKNRVSPGSAMNALYQELQKWDSYENSEQADQEYKLPKIVKEQTKIDETVDTQKKSFQSIQKDMKLPLTKEKTAPVLTKYMDAYQQDEAIREETKFPTVKKEPMSFEKFLQAKNQESSDTPKNVDFWLQTDESELLPEDSERTLEAMIADYEDSRIDRAVNPSMNTKDIQTSIDNYKSIRVGETIATQTSPCSSSGGSFNQTWTSKPRRIQNEKSPIESPRSSISSISIANISQFIGTATKEKEFYSLTPTSTTQRPQVLKDLAQSQSIDAFQQEFNAGSTLQRAEIQKMREQAIEKERIRLQRHNSAVKIQTAWKRYSVNQELARFQKVKAIRNRRKRLYIIGQRLKRSFAPWKIMNALRKWAAIKRVERLAVLEQFQNYAAQFIQKNWRGFEARRAARKRWQHLKLAKVKIASLGAIWKTKKILQAKPISDIKQQIADTEDMIFELIAERNTDLARKMAKTIPKIKGELISTFHHLYEGSSWVDFVRTTSKSQLPPRPNQEQPSQMSQSSPQVQPKAFLRRKTERSPAPVKKSPTPVRQKPATPSAENSPAPNRKPLPQTKVAAPAENSPAPVKKSPAASKVSASAENSPAPVRKSPAAPKVSTAAENSPAPIRKSPAAPKVSTAAENSPAPVRKSPAAPKVSAVAEHSPVPTKKQPAAQRLSTPADQSPAPARKSPAAPRVSASSGQSPAVRRSTSPKEKQPENEYLNTGAAHIPGTENIKIANITILDPEERPLTGVAETVNRHLSGFTGPKNKPLTEFPDPEERPLTGVANPDNRPLTGVENPDDRPLTGVENPDDRPLTGVSNPIERSQTGPLNRTMPTISRAPRRQTRVSTSTVKNTRGASQEAKEEPVPVAKPKEEPVSAAKPKFPFLRRSSLAVTSQELNFKKVESRTDCWLKRESYAQGRISSITSSTDAIRGYGDLSAIEENKYEDFDDARPSTSIEHNRSSPRLRTKSPEQLRHRVGSMSPHEQSSRHATKSYDFDRQPRSIRKSADYEQPRESFPSAQQPVRLKSQSPKQNRPNSSNSIIQLFPGNIPEESEFKIQERRSPKEVRPQSSNSIMQLFPGRISEEPEFNLPENRTPKEIRPASTNSLIQLFPGKIKEEREFIQGNRSPKEVRQQSSNSIIQLFPGISEDAEFISFEESIENDRDRYISNIDFLEEQLAEINESYVPADIFLESREFNTKIPQMRLKSFFVVNYDEEIREFLCRCLENAYSDMCQESTD